MRQTLRTVAFALVLGLVSPLASAQTPPPAPAAADAAFAAQKAAFLALPEATRKAAQEALVWLGLYVGVDDGEFGKRTRDAILAFQGNVKAPTDGALSPPEAAALLAAARKARDAAGFQVVSDPKSGARIGAPLKLIGARGGARLDFASSADADLGALYARLSAATPARKITYKAIKPDAFFVVSGQDGATMFYTRFDKNPAAIPPIRGFTFAYPASQGAYLNRVAIAVANSFEPFPGSAPAPAANAVASPAPGAAAPPAGPVPAATALVIAPGKALTALEARDCPNPTIAGKPVRIERADAATGLALLVGDFRCEHRAAAFRRAGSGPRHPWIRWAAPCGKPGLIDGRRRPPDRDRCGQQERRRRPGVRSARRAGRPRCADRERAQARRRRRAYGPARPDRVRVGPRLRRWRRICVGERRPAQRRRSRRPRGPRAPRRLLPEIVRTLSAG